MIPTNLKEATEKIINHIDPKHVEAIVKDSDFFVKAHHSLGRSIRNNWLLWKDDSVLRDWFRDNLEIGHPDDISCIILESVKSELSGKTYDPSPAIKRFHDHWANYGCNKFAP